MVFPSHLFPGMSNKLCSLVESKSSYRPLQKKQVKLCFSWQVPAAAVMLCCGHRLMDPPRHVADLQVVTLVPSLGDKVSLFPSSFCFPGPATLDRLTDHPYFRLALRKSMLCAGNQSAAHAFSAVIPGLTPMASTCARDSQALLKDNRELNILHPFRLFSENWGDT